MNMPSKIAVEQLEAIVSHATTSPNAIAVIDEEGARKTTYAQFVECVNFYAWYLKEECKLTAGDVVALHLGRCMEHFALRIACAFVGFVFVSINPENPAERTMQIIEQTGAKLVIDDEFLEKAQQVRARQAQATEEETPVEPIPCQLDTSLDDSAPYYLISTSGTTGTPKLILHDRSVFELMRIITLDFGFDTYDVRYAAMADMMFVMSVIEMLFFSSGDTLHILSNGVRSNIGVLRAYFEREDINATSTLPALLAAISPLPSLKSAFVAGEASTIDLTAFGADVLNFYGSSEVPGMAYGVACGSGALGCKFSHTDVWLEDEDGNRISPDTAGVSGEVCFCGPGVMCAYIGDAEATAAHVLREPGKRYRTYKTGDAAYYDEEGAIVLSGRLDSMVKVRGQRVDVSGVEHVLAGVAGVAECAVVAHEEAGEMVLAAFYVVTDDQAQPAPDEATLRKALEEKLPSYAVPTYFVHVDTFARKANGKIDRSILALPDVENLRATYVPPENEKQQKIVAAFEETLGLDHLGIDDDFLRLGGDSLKAMRASMVLSAAGLSVVTADVLRLRSPRALSEVASDVQDAYQMLFAADDALPLTEPQLNVYLDIQAQGKTDAYLIRENVDVPECYSLERVQEALRAICVAHPVLCRKFAEVNGTPCLVPGEMPRIDVFSSDAEALQATQQVLDITQELVRFVLVTLPDSVRVYATFHHLVFDGTSWLVFQRDLFLALEGSELTLDEGYLRAASQAATLQERSDFKEAQSFFGDMLAETDDAPLLIPDAYSGSAGRRVQRLTADASQIGAYCAQAGVSASALFMAAFAYTLSRFTGGNKALFDFLDNGRDGLLAHDSIGMFVTTCPLFVNCDVTDSRDFARQCAQMLYRATSYSFYPYRMLSARYDISASILFQYRPDIMLDEEHHSNWEQDEDFADQVHLESDLGFHVTQAGDFYQAEMTYSTRYSSETARRMLYVFEAVLQGILEGKRLGDISFVLPEDTAVQDAINATETVVEHESVLQAFEQSLAHYPDNILVTYKDKQWTYAQGAHIAASLAEALVAAGVEPQDTVAVLVPRSQWYMLCTLGVLATGAAYVPIDETYPDERISFMLADTTARAILVTPATKERTARLLDASGNKACLIDVEEACLCTATLTAEDAADVAALGASSLQGSAQVSDVPSFAYVAPKPDDIACILYTSGTTGVPKGSLITHVGLTNWAEWFACSPQMHAHDVYALYASYSFDVHMEMFTPLFVGAAVAVAPEEVRLDPDALIDWFTDAKVTTAHLPVAIAQLIKDRELPSLMHTLRTGGDKIGDLHLADKHVQLLCQYGPTEFTVDVTWIPAEAKCDSSSIGFPVSNAKLYVLDLQGRRVPLGAVGELHLSGPSIAKGYLNRPEETAAAFKPNPFDEGKPRYERMYATGDVVRQLPDGSIGFLGRRDTMVKIRGNRVECGEVEACIRECPEVSDASVQAVKTKTGTELVAYVVLKNGEGALDGDDALHDAIAARIEAEKPAYMVPTFFVSLDAIPLNANGKVDKRKLPQPDLSNAKASYVAPQSEAERAVAEAFEIVLKVEQIGLHDDFIRLGGDSIKAIRVISLLRDKNMTCQAKDVLQLRTPLRIAQALKTTKQRPQYEPMQGDIDLLPIQSRFFEKSGSSSYVQTYVVQAKERLDADVLALSVAALCDKHDMLRAAYSRKSDGAVVQTIRPLGACGLSFEELQKDVTGLAGASGAAQAGATGATPGVASEATQAGATGAASGVASEAAPAGADELQLLKHTLQESIASLDIYAGRLGRVVLVHGSQCDYVLFVLHHLVIDGVSWLVLLDDVTEMYRAIEAGEKPDTACPYPYGAWVRDVQSYANSMPEEEKHSWQHMNDLLEDAPCPLGEAKQFSFGVSSSFDAKNIYELTEEEYLLCAAARAYKKIYGADAIFNRESFGRDAVLADTNSTIGWFTAQHPLHLPLGACDELLEIGRDIVTLKQCLASVPHVGIGYGALAYATHQIEAKEAPVTFNYLSSEFSYKGTLFTAAQNMLHINNGCDDDATDVLDEWQVGEDANAAESHVHRCLGLTLNIVKEVGEGGTGGANDTAGQGSAGDAAGQGSTGGQGGANDTAGQGSAGSQGCTGAACDQGVSYLVRGEVASGTYLQEQLDAFIAAFKAEIALLGQALEAARQKQCAVYPLTGNQLGFYLDEMANNKAAAFVTSRKISFTEEISADQALSIARAMIARHPIVSSCIQTDANGPMGVCNAHLAPTCITVTSAEDEQQVQKRLREPFDISKSLARFTVVNWEDAAGEAEHDALCKAGQTSLYVCLHHLVSDGFSLDLLEREAHEFAAIVASEDATTESTAVPCLDDACQDNHFCDWGFLHTAMRDLSYRSSIDYAQARAFFADYLADVPSINSAPPQLGDGTAGRAGVCIPELSQAQRDVAAQLGMSAHGLFLAAFAYTLALFSASDKVCFNFTEHGRHSSEELRAVGMYVRSFPVVVDCADQPVSQFLSQSFASSVAAMQRSDFPLYELINDFGVNNEVTFENNAVVDLLVPEPNDGLAWEALSGGVTGIANFECTLLRGAHGYVFVVTHSGAYSKECALSFAQTYRAVLANIAFEETLADICEEVQGGNLASLEAINVQAPLVQHPDIIDAFDAQAQRTPCAVAITDTQRSFTYEQADVLSDAIALALAQQGVGQQDYALLLTGRNAFFSASMLACLKADVTYIPVDEDQPALRIARMMEIADCRLIVATPATQSRAQEVAELVSAPQASRDAHASDGAQVPDGVQTTGAAQALDGAQAAQPAQSVRGITLLCLDDDFVLRALERQERFECPVPSPESHNCILFTSGTTGDPKGIVNMRVTQSNLAQALVRVGEMTAHDVYGLYASFGYSPHLDSLVAFAAGASINVVPNDVRLDMTALCKYFDEHAITHSFLSSSIAYRLFEQTAPTTLKVVFRGGEPVKDFENKTDCRIFDEFGCTECSNIFQIEADEKIRENELGYPIDNTHVYLLDVYGRPAPRGAAGRLFVSGAQLAACVLAGGERDTAGQGGQQEADQQEASQQVGGKQEGGQQVGGQQEGAVKRQTTSECDCPGGQQEFGQQEAAQQEASQQGASGQSGSATAAVRNAFVRNTQEKDAPFERMYPTGDIACLQGGHILHLGRQDGVVKVRGNRVELGEVESCVRAHEAVADATVRTIEVNGSREIVAYVVLTEDARAALHDANALSDTLRTHVAAAKPAFMVPAYFVVLEAIPLNAHGKVDGHALPAPDVALLRAPYVACRNDAEQALVHAFEEVLVQTHLGIDDDFIRLGGDSLKAIRAAAQLEDYDVSGADILRLRTARAIAEHMREQGEDADAAGGKSAKTERAAVLQRTQDLFNEYLGGMNV